MVRKKTGNPILAFILVFVMLVTAAFVIPVPRVYAADGTEETPYIYIDGERASLDDERILNIVNVPPKPAVKSKAAGINLYAAASGSAPNVSGIYGLSGAFENEPTVTMDGIDVSSARYEITVDGISYEGYCADPMKKGPEKPDAVYEITGQASTQLKNALKNGYPINTEWSDIGVSTNERMRWVYVTRVAVAIANNPSRNFTGDSAVIAQAQSLANGGITADPNAYPIMVNAVQNAEDIGRTISAADAQSISFAITHNRKTAITYNPFRFEWASGTPAGAKLIVGGSVIATAPTNPTTVFKDDTTEFKIEMPNTAEYDGKTAAVNLVGIHNEFADTIWLMQNPNDPEGWQDIVFYIPEVLASAKFSFEMEEDIPEEAELRIIKRNSSGSGLAGAVFTITGPDGYSKQETSPAGGVIKLTGLAPGEYTVTEITPPTGHKLANPASVTVTIEPGNPGVVERIFINEPDEDTPTPEPEPEREPKKAGLPSVKIQKVDAITRENIPGALVRIKGGSSFQMTTGDGQLWEIDNTGVNISVVLTEGATLPPVPEPSGGGGEEGEEGEGREPMEFELTDGVLTIKNIPWGYYSVEEERAPEGYSLLPQHTAYSFWALPPNVKVEALDGGGEGESGEEGGGEEEPEAEPDAGEEGGEEGDGESGGGVKYIIDEEENTSSILITFENFPFGKIEVTKYDMVTGEPLAGTHFRIQGYFPEGNPNGMPIDLIQVTGGDGKTVFEDLPAGQYTISEVEAPPGYQFDHNSFRSLSLTWGETASTTFYNKPKTFVEVHKIDGDTGAMLDGAVFRLTDPTTGEIWEGTTSGGKIRIGEGEGSFGNQLVEEKLYILTEIKAPNGYVLDSSPIEVIVAADNQLNIVTVQNFLKPTLTLKKLDELTNEPLAGASFRLWLTEGETWSETQVTDENGTIVWTDLDPGIYSLQELDEPYGYFRDPARKEILLEGGDKKELIFFNRPRPVLIIFKRDAVTGLPIPAVKFKVQRVEGETIGEFLTDDDGMIELSPRTGYLLEEEVYRVTEILPPNEYLLDVNPVKDVLLKWYEPTELVFENLLKPTLIFIKRDGLTGRGITGATYRVQYESPTGGITTLGSYVTRCGLIVLPYVAPGWYILTETSPAPGYQLPTNPVVRMYLAPGENSYTYAQTQEDLYADPRTNPNSGSRGMCGDWCGYMCSVLCAGNCGNPGDGTMGGGTGGTFGNITITNGNGDPLGGGATPVNPDPVKPTLTAEAVTRLSDMTASVQFTASAEGRYYYSVVNSGANAPAIATGGLGTVCSAGVNTVTFYMTAGVKDLYIKIKDANGNVSDALKITIPAYAAPAPVPPPDFGGMVITGGTVVYINPDFSGITISFGNP